MAYQLSCYLFAFLLFFLSLTAQDTQSFSPNPWYYEHWCDNEGAASLRYLDDADCAKVFPSSFSREWECPAVPRSAPSPGFESESVALSEAVVDTRASLGDVRYTARDHMARLAENRNSDARQEVVLETTAVCCLAYHMQSTCPGAQKGT